MVIKNRKQHLLIAMTLLLTMLLGLLFVLASINPRFAVTIPLIAGHNLANVLVVVLIAAPANMALAFAMVEPIARWALSEKAVDAGRQSALRLAIASGALLAAHLGAVLPIAGAVGACQLAFLAWRQHHRAHQPWQFASLIMMLFAAGHIAYFGWLSNQAR